MIEALIGAVIGVIGTLIATSWQMRQQRSQMQQQMTQKDHELAAAYLVGIAGALSGMTVEFDKGLIPYEQGHLFERLIEDYEPKLHQYLGDKDSTDLRKLQDLARRAEEQDGQIDQGIIDDPSKQSELLADMRRMAGDLRAKAIKIWPTVE